MVRKLVYLSGPPGSGKSSIVEKFAKKGVITFNELVDKFPIKKYSNPRSFSTAKYVFEQNVKRDKLIRKEKGLIIVDRHPFDNLIIAKGLLEKENDYLKIKELYKKYKFLPGRIIKLVGNEKIYIKRYKSKRVELISEKMIDDIFTSFRDYSDFLIPDLKINSSKDLKSIVNELSSYL